MNYGFLINLSDHPDGRTWHRYISSVLHHEVFNPKTLEVIAEGGDILDQKLACLLDDLGVDCLSVTSAPDRHNLFIRECLDAELDDEFLHVSLRGNCLTDNYGRMFHSHYITLTIGA